MTEFFMAMIPPTATAQEHKVAVRNGKPIFYDPPDVKAAKEKLTANLARHRPPEKYICGIRLVTKWLFPNDGKHKNGEYKISKHDTYNLQKMFGVVKEYFKKEYGYAGDSIILSNNYQHTINSYIYNDRENPAFIHIDELFESTVIAFLLSMFKWSKDFGNLEIYCECFKYVLFLMNDVCIFGKMQGTDSNDVLLGLVSGDIQILQLAEDCYWTIVVFSLAHEVAHAYLAYTGRQYSKQHPEKEEYNADMMAYHIVLKIIMEKEGEEQILEKYTYLAPMMYMDFFDLYYYTDRVLYKSRLSDPQHPWPVDRKNRLFAVVNKDEYDFDTVDGNHLYSGFLDVYDEYKDQVLLKMERGKLDKILHTERRNRMRCVKV